MNRVPAKTLTLKAVKIMRENVKDAHTLWKRLCTKGFQRWETLVTYHSNNLQPFIDDITAYIANNPETMYQILHSTSISG